MPASVETLHPQHAAAFLQRLEEKGQHNQLYRVIYFSVTRDETDLNQVWVHKCTVHLFAEDCNDAYALFSNNVPEHYPCNLMISCAPVQPDIGEDSMLEVVRGPRAVQ